MRSPLRISSWFALAIALVVGCSARGERAARSGQAVVGGTPDTVDDAIAYITTNLDASTAELCTGTLIAPQVVLTAGHCTLGQSPATLIVGFASSTQDLSDTFGVSAVVTYPGFSGSAGDVQGGLDVGLILLNEAPEFIAPIAIDFSDPSALVGKSVSLVGFGYEDPASQGSSGTKSTADVTVNGVCSALLAFGDATHNACHGDSGGPLLARGSDGTVSLVGVVSFGDDVHCATWSYAVRIDRFVGWLTPYISNGPAPGTCTTCPVAATDCAALEAGDAGVDADAPADASANANVNANEDASPAPPASTSSGGCTCAAAGRAHGSDAALLLLVVLGFAVSRRAQKRAVRLPTAPPGRG